MSIGKVLPPFHESTDRGGSGVEDRHLVLLDYLPPPVTRRSVRRSFVHDRGDTVGERSVDDVAVAGYPSDIGCSPEHVAFRLDVEDQAMSGRYVRQIATRGVEYALRLGGGPARVHDVEGLFGVEHLRLVGVGLTIDEIVPPMIAALGPLDGL